MAHCILQASVRSGTEPWLICWGCPIDSGLGDVSQLPRYVDRIRVRPFVASCESLALPGGADGGDHFQAGEDEDQAMAAGAKTQAINPVDHMAKCR